MVKTSSIVTWANTSGVKSRFGFVPSPRVRSLLRIIKEGRKAHDELKTTLDILLASGFLSKQREGNFSVEGPLKNLQLNPYLGKEVFYFTDETTCFSFADYHNHPDIHMVACGDYEIPLEISPQEWQAIRIKCLKGKQADKLLRTLVERRILSNGLKGFKVEYQSPRSEKQIAIVHFSHKMAASKDCPDYLFSDAKIAGDFASGLNNALDKAEISRKVEVVEYSL
jgi:hypothetical protein